MVTEQTELKGAGHFIVSEANGTRSRTNGVIAAGQNLETGAVVGIVTASGEYAIYDNLQTDGTETVAGVLYEKRDATAEAKDGVIVDLAAELKQAELIWKDAGAQTAGEPEFAALHIKLI